MDMNGVGQNMDNLTCQMLLDVIKGNLETRVVYKGLGNGGRKVKQVVEALKENTSLTDIDFSSWEVGSGGGRTLSKFIKVTETVQTLRLNNNNIGAEGGDAIAFALFLNKSITHFEYTTNYLSVVGFSALGRHLAKHDTLRYLHLSVSGNGENNVGLSIAKGLAFNRGLVTLDIACIGDEAIPALMRSLKVNTTLRKLVLRPGLNHNGLKALHDAREELSLKELSCEFTQLKGQPTAGRLLGETIASLKTVSELKFDSCWFHETVADMCEGLAKNRSIVRLRLGDKNVIHLQKALVVNTSLTDINLRSNSIKSKGCHRLLDALRTNRRIQHMDLSRNFNIPDGIKGMFDLLLESNKHFQQATFLRQLKSDKQLPWQRCRLMVVGEGGAGKTATVRALTNKRFDEEWKSTIGISMEECRTTTKGLWAEAARGGFALDMASRLMVQEANNGPEGTSNRHGQKPKGKGRIKGRLGSSTEEETGIAGLTPEHKEEEEDSVGVTEGKDVEEKTVATMAKGKGKGREGGEEKRGRMEMDALKLDDSIYVETKNNMDSIKLTLFDMGGQRVFYTIHHLFLTSNAVYLVIFSLAELETNPEKSLSFLKHWVQSINIHAPVAPLLFVGTFLDQLQEGSLLPVVQKLFDTFADVATSDTFIAVSNRTGAGVVALRDKIEATIAEQSFVYTPVSVRWMKALDVLLKSQQPWTTYATFREQARRSRMTSMAEVNEALKLFHLFGSVLYFDGTESLKDLIVHDPQWLIDQVSKVIRDARIHGLDTPALRQAGLEEDGQLLLDAGLVSRDLLELLWDLDQVEYLTSLMQSLLLMSPIRMQGSDSASYLVPSMANAEKHLSESETRADEHCRFVFEAIPQGVFERVVCTCVSYSEAQQGPEGEARKPLISVHQGVVWFAPEHRVVLERVDHDATVLQLSIQGAENVKNTVAVMETMLNKVKVEFMNGSLQWTTQIKADDTWMSYAAAKKQCMSPWFDQGEEVHQQPSASIQLDDFLNSL